MSRCACVCWCVCVLAEGQRTFLKILRQEMSLGFSVTSILSSLSQELGLETQERTQTLDIDITEHVRRLLLF